jgi:hypothetical protein
MKAAMVAGTQPLSEYKQARLPSIPHLAQENRKLLMTAVATPLEVNSKNPAASEKLTPDSKIAISVLFASTFTVILNEMLMAWLCRP